MGFVDEIKPIDVQDAEMLAQYIQQVTGTPMPRGKELAAFRRYIKDFLNTYPHLSYQTLCRVVDWVRAKHRRCATPMQVINQYKWAWQAGAIPEFYDAHANGVSVELSEALRSERDHEWCVRLTDARDLMTTDNARKVLEEWNSQRAS